jgi:hypothetical protein
MDFHANEVNVPVLLWSKMEAWADLDKIRLFTTAEGGFIFLIHVPLALFCFLNLSLLKMWLPSPGLLSFSYGSLTCVVSP